MSMSQEFKEFALKGNMMDLAVGVIIGGAFGKIIDSIVNDLVMPLIAFVLGGKIDFSNMFLVMGENPNNLTTLTELKDAGIPVFGYGNFITVAISFFLLAFVVFMLVKSMNKMRKAQEAEAPAEPTTQEVLLAEIRDALKK